MNAIPTLQHLEYMEAGFELSKILAHAGYRMDSPAFVITWGTVAEVLAHTLADYGLTPDRLDEIMLLDLVQGAQKALENEDMISWRETLRQYATSNPGIKAIIEPLDLDIEDDEGPLTEQYENATRLGDDEAYWPDGGASADFFDDF
jgi:hypothetical protein